MSVVKKKIWFMGVIFLCLLHPIFTITGRAEIQPFYNFSVTIDRAEDVRFNEKLEIYVEKDGVYYADYDLGKINQYQYQTELERGEYRVYARVRYDDIGTYRIEPEYQDVKIGDLDYKEMHSITFRVIGGISLDEGHEDEMEEIDSEIQGEVYTMDQIEELKRIQEEARTAASKAFQENEEWERNHNFLSRHGIENPDFSWEEKVLPDHSYPDMETERTEKETEKEIVEPEPAESEKNEEGETKESQNVEEIPGWIVSMRNIFVISSFTLTSAAILVILRNFKRKKNEK